MVLYVFKTYKNIMGMIDDKLRIVVISTVMGGNGINQV